MTTTVGDGTPEVVPVSLETAVAAGAGYAVAAQAAAETAAAKAAITVSKTTLAGDYAQSARVYATRLQAATGICEAAAEAVGNAEVLAAETATHATTAQGARDTAVAAATAAVAAADRAATYEQGLLPDGSVTLAKLAASALGTGPNKLVQRDEAGRLPVADGSNLTGLTIGQISGSRWPLGYLSGLSLSYAGTTSFSVAIGAARSENAGAAADMTLAVGLTKTLSPWVMGTGNGSLDTGAIAASTWYHAHLIREDSDGALDILLSLSATNPTMPAGWTARRRLGAVRTNGAAQLLQWLQLGDEFIWVTPIVDVDAVNPGTSAVTRTLTVPTGVALIAIISLGYCVGTSYGTALATPLAAADVAPQGYATGPLAAAADVASVGAVLPSWAWVPKRILTSTAAQIRTRMSASGASDRLGVVTYGWVDSRGRG